MSSAGYQKQREQVMSKEALDRLLGLLDSDPGLARQKYQKIRSKLIKFFEWRGCATPEEFAGETIDRVAKGLLRGARSQDLNPYLYFHRTAIDVLKGDWAERKRARTSSGGSLDTAPLADVVKPCLFEIEALGPERFGQCLQECLSMLPPESLELITRYHSPEGGLSKESRKALARSLGIPQHVLRMRAFAIRSNLEMCVSACLSAVIDK
jgi:hypothetical protein